MREWSEWRPFPDPSKGEMLIAPFGAGCYELRNGERSVLYGTGGHVAHRMTSLLPPPLGAGTRKNLGAGTRKNKEKRKYVLENLISIEYRTIAFSTTGEAADYEASDLRSKRAEYLYPT
jgi:hypothetical protein